MKQMAMIWMMQPQQPPEDFFSTMLYLSDIQLIPGVHGREVVHGSLIQGYVGFSQIDTAVHNHHLGVEDMLDHVLFPFSGSAGIFVGLKYNDVGTIGQIRKLDSRSSGEVGMFLIGDIVSELISVGEFLHCVTSYCLLY